MTEGKKFKSELWSLDEAVDLFVAEDFHDGDLVSHDWLRMALEINDAAVKKNPFVLVERMEGFRGVLLEGHQIALQNVRGRGYRVVPPHEQAHYAATEVARHMKKGLDKADALLTNTRQGELTTDERKRHTDTQVRVAALAGMVNKGRRDVFQLFEVKKIN